MFTHVQNLSLRFHLNRKTGAVLRATSRGSAAFADLLRYLSFQSARVARPSVGRLIQPHRPHFCAVAPIFLEVGIVSVYLFASYRWPFGLITSLVMASYVTATIVVTGASRGRTRLACVNCC